MNYLNTIKLVLVAVVSLVIIGGGYYISYLNKQLETERQNVLKLEISNEEYKNQLAYQQNQYQSQIKKVEQLQQEIIKIQSIKDLELKTINKLSDKHFKKAKLVEKLINKGIEKNNEELEDIINNY